jgi:hypothetical protein
MVDDGTLTDSQTVVITVTEMNTAPVLAPLTDRTISETETLTFTAVATDSDLPVQTLSYGLLYAPAGATMDSSSGLFRWTPAEVDGPGVYPVTISVSDGTLTDTASMTITVQAVNHPPVAMADAYTTPYETPLVVLASQGVLSNDLDLDHETLIATLVTGPAYGDLVLDTDGGFVYTPTVGFSGTDSFNYYAGDGLATSDVATVTLKVGTAPSYTLKVTITGSGHVSLEPPGGIYSDGKQVMLTAHPDAGTYFDGWSGAVLTMTNPLSLTMNADKVVTATFGEIDTNRRPTSNAGSDQTVNTGTAVTLDGTASFDPDGDPLTYIWQQTGGPAVDFTTSVQLSRTTFIAPESEAVLTFTLTVKDVLDLHETDSVTISVIQHSHRIFLPLISRQ